ncbi:MAG TPA: DUF2514 family protein [Buttiauxella sp.]|jgi:hypothetical protein
MSTLFKLLWKPLTIGAVLALVLWFFSHARYEAGYKASSAAWQLKDAQRQKAEALALAVAEATEREEEKRRQDEATKAALAANKEIAKVRVDAADARRAGERLQRTINSIRKQLAGSETGRLAAVADAGATRAATGILLANVLERADKRAGQLAEYADRARVAGQTCERIYRGVAAAGKP